MKEPAFLFDIDGCLTLEGYTTSILDIDLIDCIIEIDAPIAFVTGRSDGWLKKHYTEQDRLDYLQVPTYIEFGLALLHHNKLMIQDEGKWFLDLRRKLIDELAKVCRDNEVYFEPNQWYHDYPSHTSLWVENKHVMLSVASNTEIQPQEVHHLCEIAWSPYRDKVRKLDHHLGVDGLPHNWSKAKATQQFLKREKLTETDYQWYVFGDNTSDLEMMQGLTSAQFITTKDRASSTVRETLENLGVI